MEHLGRPPYDTKPSHENCFWHQIKRHQFRFRNQFVKACVRSAHFHRQFQCKSFIILYSPFKTPSQIDGYQIAYAIFQIHQTRNESEEEKISVILNDYH